MCDNAAGTVRGIVLAGIHQWDESALDAVLPRPLLPVAQTPLICYPLSWLRTGDVSEVTVCANSASRLVRQCLGAGDRLGLDIQYYEDWTPRGPAGCVRDAGLCEAADAYVVTEGTIIPQTDLLDLLAAHRRAEAAITVVVQQPAGDESPSVPLHPVGIYVFSPAALEHVPATGYQDIKEILIPRLHRRGDRVAMYPVSEACPRVTGFDSYLAVNAWMLERQTVQPAPLHGYQRRGEALVHHRACVAASAVLLGPLLVGPGAQVRENATLVGPATIGAACTVAEGATVCRSVLWDGCAVGRGSMLDQCVIAQGVQVEPGARVHGRYLSFPLRTLPRPERRVAPHRLAVPGNTRPRGPGKQRLPTAVPLPAARTAERAEIVRSK
jgi:NDP-sugar pyrophosphorylase family protein